MRLLLFSTLMLTTGCMSVCERAAALNKSFQVRQAACFAEGTLSQPFDATKCNDSMNACTAADQTALQTYFDCVERLPVCNSGNRAAFSDSFLGCATRLGTLSEGCFKQ
jgi:hypothetical protein